ncbi:hypothetical protein DFH08DRAFT_1086640 [Mycena albidolilacea]|uniref:Uncharacterized protein n=1 Tax=Mycena albidolilacea TaxID=1033008 RepID=A0AAD6ZD88_9AGAR|nr:hypothetical protein DFH08DRAFT_1086640 [Mycena albidolilacea]
MSFPLFRSTSSQLHPDRDENVPMRDRDSAESLLHSAVELLKISPEAPKRRRLNSSRALQVLSLVLHSLLVGIHLALLAIWARGLEHRITFSLDNQKTVNFRITAIANAFGTIYAAALVFVTQRLWTRQSLRADQTLTATHDSAAAWTGIGSALSQLWSQRTMSGSIVGVLSVFLYLANILVLHITTPALFSFETFNSTRPVHVATRSLPSLDYFSQVNWSDPDNAGTAMGNFVESDYVTGSLYFLPSILGSNTSLGLKDGTLYDVVDINSGVGNVTVDATGFDITCGYLTDVNITHRQSTTDSDEYWFVDFCFDITCGYLTDVNITHRQSTTDSDEYWFVDFCFDITCGYLTDVNITHRQSTTDSDEVGNVTVDATGFDITCNYLTDANITHWKSTTYRPEHWSMVFGPYYYELNLTQRGIICSTEPTYIDMDLYSSVPPFHVDFYSTVPIMDSNNYLPEVKLNSPMNTFADPVSSVQVFRCSQSLVNQKAVVDAQTRQILAVEPNIHKTTSTWLPHIGRNSTNATDNVFMQAWHWLYNYAIPESTYSVDPAGKNSRTLSVADLYLNQKLTLQQVGETVQRTVKLHDLENTLSSIIASIYWTLGNVHPQAILANADDGTIQIGTSDSDSDAPTLLRGNTEVTEVSTQGRLASDMIATAGGLVASVTLFLLSLRYSLFSKSHKYQTDNPIDGTGILQAIWLYRNHPELEARLDQVDNPTEANLREAGMVRTRDSYGGRTNHLEPM